MALARRPLLSALVFLVLVSGCSKETGSAQVIEPAIVRTGADVLVASGYEALRGRRVGLIANHTSTSGSRHLADLMHEAPGVRLVALFGPEHGIRGDQDAGRTVGDTTDASTGLPVYSLYGERRSPPASVLDSIDVLVFDIQDVGARFYTYISTMGRSMEAAAAAGIEFMVLDRPNPVGGTRVDGFVLEPGFESFVGLFPIPVQHGLTVGELARMAVGEQWLPGLDRLQLTVVEAEGWTRDRLWPDTGLEWVPTSPNIPDFETALLYPGLCFFEGLSASEGRGTDHPFLLVGAPWLDAGAAVGRLSVDPPVGVRFEAVRYTPTSRPGRSTSPRFMDQEIAGIRIHVIDPANVRPLEVGARLLEAFFADPNRPSDLARSAGLARLAGTKRLEDALLRSVPASGIVALWADEVARFDSLRASYLLYD